MDTQAQATSRGRYGPDSYRTTARTVGAIYLAAMVTYAGGDRLVQSVLAAPAQLAAVPANSGLLAIGALLMLVNSALVVGHGVMMFPLLRRHDERIAVGYLGARLVESVVLAVGIVCLLLNVPLGRESLKATPDIAHLQAISALSVQANLYAYEIGMTAVGFAGLMLCYLFYRATLVPRSVAVWGLVGYAVLLSGSVAEVLGLDLRLLHTLPGGLWELFIGVWLIARGFSPSSVSSERSASSTAPRRTSPEAGSVTI